MQPKDTARASADAQTDDKTSRNNKEPVKASVPLKVVIRHLPPNLTEETFVEQVAPLPEHDYFCFVRGDPSLGQSSFSRAYVNFANQDDLFIFTEKFDGYVFLDNKGNEFPAIVEFAPFQKVPKKKIKKNDSRKGTIEQDADYIKFVESLGARDEGETALTLEQVLEEIEAKQRANQENAGKVSTHLIDYLKRKKGEKKQAKDERRKREEEKRKKREEERRRRRDKERERESAKYKAHESKGREGATQDHSDSDADKQVKVLKKSEEEATRDRKSSSRGPQSDRFQSKKASAGREQEYEGARGKERERLGKRDSEYENRDSYDKIRDSRSKRDYDYKERGDSREKRNFDFKERGDSREKRDFDLKERADSREKRYDDRKERKVGEKDYRKGPEHRKGQGHTGYKDLKEEARVGKEKRTKDYDGSGERERKEREKEKKEKQRKERERREQARSDREKRDKRSTQGDDVADELDKAKAREGVEGSVRKLKSDESERRGSADNSSDSGKDSKPARLRYKDRPERQIYNPAQRAAERKRQQQTRQEAVKAPPKAPVPEDA